MRVSRALLAASAVLSLSLAACGGTDAPAGPDETPAAADGEFEATEPVGDLSEDVADQTEADTGDAVASIALLVNGELGDESFFDSANRGVQQAADELGVDVRVIETGYETASWEPALRSAAAGGEFDLILTGTFPMVSILETVATEFPEQQFVLYDAVLDMDNVYSVTYAQNEGSFLAGALAALVTTSDELENATPDNLTVGWVGGQDLPVINDFRVGYEAGVAYIDDGIEVLTSFAGDFGDPARGLELATTQFNQGADIVFQVAGGTGIGVIEAAANEGRYAIGVDSNQNGLAPGTVLTSMLKNVDVSLYRAIELYLENELPFGEAEALGIDEGGVGLAKDDLYEQYVPQSIRDRIDEVEDEVAQGNVEIPTALE